MRHAENNKIFHGTRFAQTLHKSICFIYKLLRQWYNQSKQKSPCGGELRTLIFSRESPPVIFIMGGFIMGKNLHYKILLSLLAV